MQIIYFYLYSNPTFVAGPAIAILLDLAWFLVILGWALLCLSIINGLNDFFVRNQLGFPKTRITAYIILAVIMYLPQEQRINIYTHYLSHISYSNEPEWLVTLNNIAKILAILSALLFNMSMIIVIYFLADCKDQNCIVSDEFLLPK